MSEEKNFSRKKLWTWNRLNTKFKKIKKLESKKSTKNILKIIIYVILFFIIVWFLLLIVLYNKYIKDLDVTQLKDYKIAESSILYDVKWREIYKFYEEKRTYVDYEEISPNIVNALVAWEDKRYWENPWVDIIWLMRAWVMSIVKQDTIAWTSTLTQQLIRNTIIENRRSNETVAESIDRKFKEIFLSYKLTKELSKEKILELYLNKIEFWHNAFGIEEASKTFFNKSAKDVNIFEWSILASLPKWPTHYSPYNHQDRLVWYLILEQKNEETWKTEKNYLITKEQVSTEKELVNQLKEKIKKLKWKWIDWSDKYVVCNLDKSTIQTKSEFNVDSEWCVVTSYSRLMYLISDIKVEVNWKSLVYYPWRKDYILQRMLEDNYINFEDYINATLEWFGYEFSKVKDSKIIAPHFVFYVREYLEEKYKWENISTLWLKIYTTLDLDVQKKAEEIVQNQAKINNSKFNAKNAALISIDNKTWWIIAMVWSADYYSSDWKWQVNVITSRLQPGSSFKPFVYSLAMYQNELWTKTPIYDVETTFPWNYTPKNFDGKFMWKINISTALNYSRNIPAIKMFYMTSWVDSIIAFMNKLWATSITKEENYWASIALWTARITPLDLAKAYSVFANMWEKVEISPIVKILDSKWMELPNPTKEKEKVITSGQTFLINNILSTTSDRPSSWNNYLSIWRTAAVKTWTSTKPIKEGSKTVQYPANLWTAWYTPQITTVVWAWNTDWETLKYSWSWLEAAAPIWRDFMKYYHKWLEVEEWEKPSDVKNIKISEISWLLPNPERADDFLVSSYFVNPPKKIDNSYQAIEYDSLCNWKVTENTPIAAIKKSVILNIQSLKPDLPYWENPVQAWLKTANLAEKYWATNGWEIITVKDEVCNRAGGQWDIVIKSTLDETKNYSTGLIPIDIAFQSSSPIVKIEVLVNNTLTHTLPISDLTYWATSLNLAINPEFINSKVKIEIRALNNEYFSNSEIKNINVWEVIEKNISENWWTGTVTQEQTEDKNNSSDLEIYITNPKSSHIKLYEQDYFNLRFQISPTNNLSNVNVIVNNEIYESLWNQGNYVIPVNSENKLPKWVNNLKIQAISPNGNKTEKTIQVEIL